jgi:hypothetical protein
MAKKKKQPEEPVAEELPELDEQEVDEVEAEGDAMLVYVVRKVGPFALFDPDGEQIADDTKSAVMALARDEATNQMQAGFDTQVVELDDQERVIRVMPYYPGDQGEVQFEEDDPAPEGPQPSAEDELAPEDEEPGEDDSE